MVEIFKIEFRNKRDNSLYKKKLYESSKQFVIWWENHSRRCNSFYDIKGYKLANYCWIYLSDSAIRSMGK